MLHVCLDCDVSLTHCLFRDHEIDRNIWTPARNHLVFPDMKVKRKICSYNLLDKEKDGIPLRQSFADLPPKRTLVPNLVTKESVSIQSGGSAKVMEKKCFKKDIYLSTESFRFDMARKYSKDQKMSLSNKSLPSAENKLSSRNDNLSSSTLLHARSQQQKLVSRRIEKPCLEKPLAKKFKNSLNTANADMEERYFMCIII